MQRLKTAIKRMAAIGAGIAMLGATMTSAVAADLSDYPAPFVDVNGVFDESTAIVVGEGAAASDTLGAVDIATNLQFMAKTPVASSSGTVSVVGGVTEDVPIGMGIANSTAVTLDWSMDDNDITSFQDTVIAFQGADYDVHDELVLSKQTPYIATSLTSLGSVEDDYESGVFMEVLKGSIKYYYAFDDAINISTATTTEPLEIKFLGKTLKITSVEKTGGAKFTAYVGAEYFMDVGDVVTVEGKKVTLSNVGSGGAIVVDVDGTLETISASTTKTINGIEVTNDETFYADAKEERSASLVVGKDSQATYKDSDAYVGEDTSDPDWVWDIGSIGQNIYDSTTISQGTPGSITLTGPTIGIENYFIKDDSSDNPPGIGECLDLPNEYASICLDSLTIPDNDYTTLTIEYASGEDTGNANSPYGSSSAKTIRIKTPVEESLILPKSSDALGLREGNGTVVNEERKTNEVWLQKADNNEPLFAVFYKDSNYVPSTKYWGLIETSNSTNASSEGAYFLKMNYKSTKDTNIKFKISNVTAANTQFNLWLDIEGDSTSEITANTDNIVMNWTISSGNFSSLGDTVSKEESGELSWSSFLAKEPNNATLTALGTKDEDHRTKYGIIIKDPKSNGASDKVVLEIPSDDVQANIVIKGQATTVTGGATSYIPADISIDTKLDTEVANPASYNLILVGGSAVNSLTAKFIGAASDWKLASGEALIKLVNNGDKIALIVAGTDAIDTRMAAKVIANYKEYKLETTEAVVTGTLSAPQIKVA